tara:strand:+ start:535 stop:783 length:249 start_codon:yes stop_codon:yes gene_type:complete
MPAQTFQTSRDWIRRNVDDEKDGSAICLTFPPYAKYMIPKINSEAAQENKSKVMFIRDAVMKYIREKEEIRKENKAIRGEML